MTHFLVASDSFHPAHVNENLKNYQFCMYICEHQSTAWKTCLSHAVSRRFLMNTTSCLSVKKLVYKLHLQGTGFLATAQAALNILPELSTHWAYSPNCSKHFTWAFHTLSPQAALNILPELSTHWAYSPSCSKHFTWAFHTLSQGEENITLQVM